MIHAEACLSLWTSDIRFKTLHFTFLNLACLFVCFYMKQICSSLVLFNNFSHMNLRFWMFLIDQQILSNDHCITLLPKLVFGVLLLFLHYIFSFCIICFLSLTTVPCPKICGTWLVQQFIIGKQSNINKAR